MTPIRPTSLTNRMNDVPPTIYPYLFNEIGYVLMSPLNIHPEEDRSVTKKKNNKVLKVLLGISALIAVPVIGTTLAASIAINNEAPIQFGQGVIATATCDTDINATLSTAYESGAFVLDKITLSNLNTTPTSSDVGCGGQYLKVRVYNSSGSLIEIDSTATTKTVVQFLIPTSGNTQPSTTTGNASAGTTITGWDNPSGNSTDSLILQLNNTKPAASTVDKVTVESVSSVS